MKRTDYWIIFLIIALSGLFYWRLFTWNEADALSFTTIDITTQFTPWTSYAVERIHDGELPLWNPYMYGGTSFIADPQNAVFYPMRWATLGFLTLDNQLQNSDILFALEIEMVVHVALGTLLMYLFLRRHTSPPASFAGAVIWGFGGYMTSYPPAQLPVLETAIWIPLILYCIDRISPFEDQIRWNWVLASGCAFGISILAGHTQTSMMTGYLALAYIIYVLWGRHWRRIALVVLLFGLIAVGLSAIQTLPTAEFQMQTTRQDFNIDHKGTGFAWHEFGMVLLPRVLGNWSPLYVGILTLGLVGVAIMREKVGFWAGTSLVALALSVGQRSVLYSVFYVIVPGVSFFRSQERFVLIFVVSVSIMAAYGVDRLVNRDWTTLQKRYLIGVWIVLIVFFGILAAVFWYMRLDKPSDSIEFLGAQSAMFSLLLSTASLFVFWRILQGQRYGQWMIAALLVFDLFSINMNNPFNFDPVPVSEQLIEPAHIATIRDHTQPGQTVDGQRGIGFSFGSMYRVPDLYGTESLRLKALEVYLFELAAERRWDLLGVQVVASGDEDLSLPNTWLGQGTDSLGEFHIRKIDNYRPFALLYYDTEKVDSPEEAWERIADPTLNLRETVIVEEDFENLPAGETGSGSINLMTFKPEYIELQADTDQPAVASFTLPYDTGWHASIDGEDAEVLRTYGGLTGVYLEPGQHRVVLRYLPDTLIAGAVITGLTLLAVLVGFVGLWAQSRRRRKEIDLT